MATLADLLNKDITQMTEQELEEHLHTLSRTKVRGEEKKRKSNKVKRAESMVGKKTEGKSLEKLTDLLGQLSEMGGD